MSAVAGPNQDYKYTVAPVRPLLTHTPSELFATHDSLQRLVRKVPPNGPGAGNMYIAFDLANASDIDPGAVLLMMYAAYRLNESGWRTYAIDPTQRSPAMQRVSRNLRHLRLSPADRQNFPTDAGEYPLRAVFDRGTMVNELQNWSDTINQSGASEPEAVARWGVQISEVVTNSFQHGPGPSPGAVLGPVYLAGGLRDGRIQLASLDRGRGIPRAIESVPVAEIPEAVRSKGDGALIKAACGRGVSSRSTRQNQGAGLPDLIESVRANGGNLTIFSQRGYVHLNEAGVLRAHRLRKDARRLEGTLTIVSLRV